MSKNDEAEQHMGTKFLALFFGIILAMIYAIMKFFASDFNLTLADLSNIALVETFFVIVWTLIVFLAELMWRYAHKYSEKF